MTDCPNCNGAGSVRAMTTGHGPDDYEHDAECPACCGTGSADLADAINALPYSLHRVKPGVEVVSKAAVLAIIKARAALAAPAVPPADEQRESMAMMLRKCAHALQHRGREDLAADVVGLLRRYDLLGSPLRAPTAPPVKQSLTTAAAPTAQPSESNPQR